MKTDSASFLVVGEVAREEGVPPEELSPPLGTVIDAEALDRLVQSDRASPENPVEIAFEYRDYTVRVRTEAEVRVSVDDASDSPDATELLPEEGAERSD
ncbi:HalOD1 output domain-containing protein [Haloarchaeobius sp. HRN-SO-5]|uniref:HalOD1 output domain-containing protein n=1 Tax=Haloarchaeobius sp. HRN-SO-5 TaxID=3446118 RepID=UPI003EC0A907